MQGDIHSGSYPNQASTLNLIGENVIFQSYWKAVSLSHHHQGGGNHGL